VCGLPAGAAALIRGGYLAVGTFFVLSGFVLARSYAPARWDRASLFRYGAARFARIYPVYVLSLAVVSPFIAAEAVPGKAFLLADYGLLLQGWTGRLGVGWNTPAWSLSCEIFFYLCFPAAAFLIRNRWPYVLACAAVVFVLPEVLMAAGMPDMWKPLVHLSDFLIGISAARAYDLVAQSRFRPRGHWLYLPGAWLSTVLIARPEILRGATSLNSALRPLNALVLIGLALGGGSVARALSCRAAVYLGKSSYALYILHVPLLWWYKRMSGGQNALLYIALVVAVSAAVFRFVEEPANRYLRARLTPLRSRS
jgi:peptidoglycan/LPS O-acetylase OafA/YrhL